jgi:short-subunit dehydrogenase
MLDKNIARTDTIHFYYLLSKKFLAEFTKMLALEVAPNIRVNGIAPGYIIPEKNVSAEYVEKTPKLIPLQKIGNVKNIVQTLEFLLENDFINGQILSIDGGASLNHAG